MRLMVARRRPVTIPVTPIADLAFILVAFFAILAMATAAKGVGLRFADPAAEPLPPTEATGAIWIHVTENGAILVDGKDVPRESLIDHLAGTLLAAPGATVVLYTEPTAAYQSMISAYDVLLQATSRQGVVRGRLAVPTRAQVAGWTLRHGRDPFGAAP